MPAENTVDLLMGTARSLRRALAAALAGWDVTPHHARALRVVCDQGRARPSVIAGELRIAPRSAGDPADRRATIVRATPGGHRLREELDRILRTLVEEEH